MTAGNSGERPRFSVSPERIRSSLRAFARIGYSQDGGINRLAFSQSDLQARQALRHRLAELDVQSRVDEIGNVFGHIPGVNDDLAPVLVGSHLDAVPGGGRFDGSIGVIAALEVAAVLRDQQITTRRPIEVVSFSCEESSRFGRATLGSGVVAGTWDPHEILQLTDRDGTRLESVLRRLGLDPARVGEARRERGAFAAYLELHIEQGRVLEAAGVDIGVVEAIAAATRLRLRVEGHADHSGATPMHLRHDALAGAAEVILAVERVARACQGIVGTVGTLTVEPGAINVVPGAATLGIDIRGSDGAAKRAAVESVRQEIATIAESRGLHVQVDQMSDEEPVPLDPGIVDLIEDRARQRGLGTLRLPSGAGHDAMQMARICPAGMVMVPSRSGVSHNREEWTGIDHVVMGIQVLADAALTLAGIA